MADATGPYILRSLIKDLPLSTEDSEIKVVITCVEYWDSNLYIGTSAGEVLHYVCLPAEAEPGPQEDVFILASRMQPTTVASQNVSKGVQQLLILPRSKRACILCNGTLTFHTLPELSPAPNTQTVPNVWWVGGLDLDDEGPYDDEDTSDYVLMSLRTKMRLLRVDERVTSPKSLDYPGCLVGARRGRYACVADTRSYALVDLENSQKIPLFPISSLDDTAISFADRQMQGSLGGSDRATNIASVPSAGHSRNTSLSAFASSLGRSIDQRRLSTGRSGIETPEPRSGAASPARPASYLGTPTQRAVSPGRPLSGIPASEGTSERSPSRRPVTNEFLMPQCVSPTSTEFFLLTGTTPNEPGVGMFVNLDGDVVRGTLEFTNFPLKLIVDGGQNLEASTHGMPSEDNEGYILAAMERSVPDGVELGLEIHRWDDQTTLKAWLSIGRGQKLSNGMPNFGIGKAQTSKRFRFHEIGDALRSAKLEAGEARESEENNNRNTQENEFAERLGLTKTRVMVWHNNQIFWAVKNPVLLQLDSAVEAILQNSETSQFDQARLIGIFNNVLRQEARSETEFLSLEFIRQKISLILFADLAINRDEVDVRINEKLLLDGGADPRVILTMVPFLRNDIFQGKQGIMMPAGIVSMVKQRLNNISISLEFDPVLARPEDFDVLGLLKRYLTAWRQRKGFGSIADETLVFASVDAALIHVLLHQDQQTSLLPERFSTAGVELYAIVDNSLDCFDRAVELLEEYHRLYALSRLYQSRGMARKKLETWRRILDGEPDDGGGFPDGELQLRTFLTTQTDRSLVEEYGSWLARRNPNLGVQVFTDDTAKVKLTPSQISDLLRREAPDSVKVYLEHLVFGKKRVEYADELISYYLDNVLSVLAMDEAALTLLANSYTTYRALSAPKPTYRQFITDNAIPDNWWHDRLRLLELLGGSYGAGFSYNVHRVLARIQPFEDALVPESIILEGRQGQHLQALKLLTHGLGDYHTAINYCLLGGSSVFHPAEGTPTNNAVLPTPSRAEETMLFRHLLSEFLAIQSPESRLEQTSELLGRFGSWFELVDVLQQIPQEWPVGVVADFLCSALRRSVSEKNESILVRALSGAENLKVSVSWAEKMEGMGPHIVPAMDTPDSMA